GHGETSLSAQQDVVVAQPLQLAVEDGEAGDDGGGGHGGVDQDQGVLLQPGLLDALGDADRAERGGGHGQVRTGPGLLEALGLGQCTHSDGASSSSGWPHFSTKAASTAAPTL